MKKIKLLILALFLATTVRADTVQTFFDYGPNSTVTDVNLDGNLNNIRNVLNGRLDNDNANSSEFRFFEIRASLPLAGTQGRIVFLTTDDVLYYDSGTTWVPFITVGSGTQGDMIYFDGTRWVTVNKNTTATRYLSNTGTSNNPAWAQVNLTNGVTGNLPLGNGGTGNNLSTIAKGGLIVGTASNTVGIQTVGANNTVLTADSAQTNGVKWEAKMGIWRATDSSFTSGDSGNITITTSAAPHVIIVSVDVATDDTMMLRFNSDSSGGDYDYISLTSTGTTTTTATTSAADQFGLSAVDGGSNDAALFLIINFKSHPSDANRVLVDGQGYAYTTAGAIQRYEFTGIYRGSAAPTAFNIFSSGGATVSGNIYLYERITS